MKRSAIQRKTPLLNRAPMARKPIQKRRKAARKASTDTRWRSERYLAFVRSLPCCACGGRATDAHHVIGLHWGLSGMATTAPDSFSMPVCRVCHQAIHASPEMQARQPGLLTDTINRGLDHFTDEPIVGALADALEFIAAKEDAK
ncbi:DUF968 domain-containing protein [Halomonas denitrificans]|uniref:DUF968 domain-containing protein n=1 Tax=Halomonas denitrificans TaxID=370769 RepID=UPI001CD42BDF|nr:DUF968 domain-containing protein [Halomonas denitrificans]MCA0973428.1 DUF968 domain-containing protein [Halomonas denitrificans]